MGGLCGFDEKQVYCFWPWGEPISATPETPFQLLVCV